MYTIPTKWAVKPEFIGKRFVLRYPSGQSTSITVAGTHTLEIRDTSQWLSAMEQSMALDWIEETMFSLEDA
jgi:hypothetical protein